MTHPLPPALLDQARQVLDACRARGWRLATAESCTGGLVAAALTEHAGSSDVVELGLVTYSNAAKEALLGVRAETLVRQGAVSELTAREMAEGALARAGVDLAVSITGIAGPGGATATKPVGLVHIACAVGGRPTRHERHLFKGDRSAVRLAAVEGALRLLLAQARPQDQTV
jgi:nicotinamide-nucleotide amidase